MIAERPGGRTATNGARARRTEHARDERGIALQTIIIIVVLLAIAGTVATVLLTRAGEETDRLAAETDRWSEIGNETGCDIAGGVWSNPGDDGTCGAPGSGDNDDNNNQTPQETPHDAGFVHTPSDAHGGCHTDEAGDPPHSHTQPGPQDTNGDGVIDGDDDEPPYCV